MLLLACSLGGTVFLTGCQTLHSKATPHKSKPSARHAYAKKEQEVQDGAPKGPLPTFFSAIKPKVEPLSRYGNPATYEVAGRRYAVMNSSKEYKQRGLASWYGTKFHSHRTSSGEHYDMYALTAAHKTLPLPTYVRVKNLDNGRVAIVKVNDRGPFHPGRIIDLSYGAAAKLGVFPKGTARVEIEAIAVRGAQAKYLAPSSYFIQAGAFTTMRTADQLRRQIARGSKLPVFVKREKNQYLVRIGPFTDRKMMERARAQLSKLGIRGSFSLLA